MANFSGLMLGFTEISISLSASEAIASIPTPTLLYNEACQAEVNATCQVSDALVYTPSLLLSTSCDTIICSDSYEFASIALTVVTGTSTEYESETETLISTSKMWAKYPRTAICTFNTFSQSADTAILGSVDTYSQAPVTEIAPNYNFMRTMVARTEIRDYSIFPTSCQTEIRGYVIYPKTATTVIREYTIFSKSCNTIVYGLVEFPTDTTTAICGSALEISYDPATEITGSIFISLSATTVIMDAGSDVVVVEVA